MTLVNCAVVSHNSSRTILLWTVMPLEPSGYSVLGFYEAKLQQEVMVKCDEEPSGSHEQTVKLHSVFIGKSKELMDLIEVSVNLDRAVQMFGAYLKYCVVLVPSQPVTATKNAFTILIQSQKALQQKSKLPSKSSAIIKKIFCLTTS